MTHHAYVAVSPRGAPIISTIRQTADESWRQLRASLSDPDSLHDAGWHIRIVEVIVGDRVE